MSVSIENMKMPRNCVECPLQYGGWCYVTPPDIDERIAENMEKASVGRPLWCPLVERKTADVMPVVHGHWKAITTDVHRCSNCGQLVRTKDIVPYRFCNVCGAKMDESEENNNE